MSAEHDAFPIGAALAGAGYVICENVRGEVARGMYRAMTPGDPQGRTVIVTVGTRQTVQSPDLQRRLSLPVEGVARLRHIGPLAGRGTEYSAMVEDEPAGRPVADVVDLPMQPWAAVELATAIGGVLERVHAEGQVVRHLRPELIYVVPNGTGGQQLTQLVPRAEEFLRTADPPCYGVPPMFDSIFLPPEVIELRDATPAADVFALAAVLAFWLTGEHPFEGEDAGRQLFAIHGGQRRPWTGPPALGPVLQRALTAKPDQRPPLADFVAELRERARPN